MRIDHGAFADPGADVDVRRGHHHDTLGKVGAGTHCAATGHNADALLRIEAAGGIRPFVHEAEGGCATRLRAVHAFEHAHAEAKQDATLHPGVHAPAGRLRGVGLGGAQGAGFQGFAKPVKDHEGFGVADGLGAQRKEVFDGLLEGVLRIHAGMIVVKLAGVPAHTRDV